jgi:hypothetical protein
MNELFIAILKKNKTITFYLLSLSRSFCDLYLSSSRASVISGGRVQQF